MCTWTEKVEWQWVSIKSLNIAEGMFTGKECSVFYFWFKCWVTKQNSIQVAYDSTITINMLIQMLNVDLTFESTCWNEMFRVFFINNPKWTFRFHMSKHLGFHCKCRNTQFLHIEKSNICWHVPFDFLGIIHHTDKKDWTSFSKRVGKVLFPSIFHMPLYVRNILIFI